jgi:hypothetical protein
MTIAGALRGGWRALDHAFWIQLGAAGVLLLSELAEAVFRSFSRAIVPMWPGASILAVIGFMMLLRFAVHCLIRPGLLALNARCVRGERVTLDMLVSRTSRSPALAAAELLRMGTILGCALVALMPGVAFALLGHAYGMSSAVGQAAFLLGVVGFAFGTLSTTFVDRIVCLERTSAVQALREAWRLSRSNRLKLAVLLVVTTCVEGLGVFVGLLLCGVGLLFTLPATRAFTDAVFTHAYLQLRYRPVFRLEPLEAQ